MSKHTVIGEGSFGCIHQPSLHCKEDIQLDYNQYISKLMKTENAEKELREFVIISNLDKQNEYHLGTPTICEPNIKEQNFSLNVDKCKRFNSKQILEHPANYRLLIQKSGGYDLSYFCKNYLKQFTQSHENNNLLLWLEVYNLLKGLHFFKKHDIIHYDLKPQNIVFNPQTKKFMFIDFGLMNTKTNIIQKSTMSTNNLSTFHWSYPIDNGFLNKTNFTNYKMLSDKKKNKLKESFTNTIITGTNWLTDTQKIVIKNPSGFQLFFSYIYLPKQNNSIKQFYDLSTFFKSYDNYTKNNSYEKVIEKTIDSIDIYGLGFTLKFMLNQCFKINAVSSTFYNKASVLFESMYNFNIDLRVVSIDKIMDIYEQILLDTGVLYALNKKIVNRKITDNNYIIPDIISISETKIDPNNLTPELEEYAHKDAVEVANNFCENPEKEVNPLTKKCVKKCVPQKIRDEHFRCVKAKTSKRKMNNVAIRQKNCPEFKEVNPLTKRCIKKCKEPRFRDDCFRCVKTRSVNKNITKICKDNKEVNPFTGRCVKKCKEPRIRNNCFRCTTKKIYKHN